jgi:hypothetical protein
MEVHCSEPDRNEFIPMFTGITLNEASNKIQVNLDNSYTFAKKMPKLHRACFGSHIDAIVEIQKIINK